MRNNQLISLIISTVLHGVILFLLTLKFNVQSHTLHMNTSLPIEMVLISDIENIHQQKKAVKDIGSDLDVNDAALIEHANPGQASEKALDKASMPDKMLEKIPAPTEVAIQNKIPAHIPEKAPEKIPDNMEDKTSKPQVPASPAESRQEPKVMQVKEATNAPESPAIAKPELETKVEPKHEPAIETKVAPDKKPESAKTMESKKEHQQAVDVFAKIPKAISSNSTTKSIEDIELDLKKNLARDSHGKNPNSKKRKIESGTGKHSVDGGGTDDAVMSATERAIIENAIKKEWYIFGIEQTQDFALTVDVFFEQDGTIKNFEIQNLHCAAPSHLCKSMQDAAIRAIQAVNKIDGLDPDRYHIWKKQTIIFNPLR